jgi:glucans biosynthesis protein C
MDNLRALAMLVGIYLHAAFAYANPSQSLWIATDPSSSIAIDASIWFIHLFRMSLFFLLSGYFARRVIDRKGAKQFLWGRFLRIAVPFVVFYPFLLAAVTVVIVFALSYLSNPKGLMGWIAAIAQDTSGAREPPPWTTMHLWFLYYLFLFNLLTPLLAKLPTPKWTWILERPLGWLFLPLLLVPGVMIAGAPIPAPESFVPAVWPFLFYGPFYAIGWQLAGQNALLAKLTAKPWPMLGISLVIFVLYYNSMPTLDLGLADPTALPTENQTHPLAILCTAYLSVLLTFTAMGLGRRYFDQRNAYLAFIADASYWLYLIHLPIVLFIQTLLIPVEMSVWIKLIITLSVTFVACMATYVVFVRYTPIGWLLHGKRAFP